jgi:hypothetical protein
MKDDKAKEGKVPISFPAEATFWVLLSPSEETFSLNSQPRTESDRRTVSQIP